MVMETTNLQAHIELLDIRIENGVYELNMVRFKDKEGRTFTFEGNIHLLLPRDEIISAMLKYMSYKLRYRDITPPLNMVIYNSGTFSTFRVFDYDPI